MNAANVPAYVLECAAGRLVACGIEREADLALARVVLKWFAQGRPAAAVYRANSRPQAFAAYLLPGFSLSPHS